MSHGRLRNNTVRPRSSLFPYLLPPFHLLIQGKSTLCVNSGRQNSTRNHPCFFRTCQAGFFLPQGLCTCQPLCLTCSPQGTCKAPASSPLAPATKVWLVKPCLTTKDTYFLWLQDTLASLVALFFYLAHTAVKLWFMCFFYHLCLLLDCFILCCFPTSQCQEQQLAGPLSAIFAEGMGRWGVTARNNTGPLRLMVPVGGLTPASPLCHLRFTLESGTNRV